MHRMHSMNARKRNGISGHLTVRGVDPVLSRALQKERKRRGTTLNQTVLDLLGRALGVSQPFDNGLGKYAGGWTEEQLKEFQRNTACFDQIDEDLWK